MIYLKCFFIKIFSDLVQFFIIKFIYSIKFGFYIILPNQVKAIFYFPNNLLLKQPFLI